MMNEIVMFGVTLTKEMFRFVVDVMKVCHCKSNFLLWHTSSYAVFVSIITSYGTIMETHNNINFDIFVYTTAFELDFTSFEPLSFLLQLISWKFNEYCS